jgi:hypothetical protein
MCAVTRLRGLAFRSWLMPLLVAAMACRALAPAGFMTTSDSSPPVIASTLCSLDQNRRERLEFPAQQQRHAPRCDHCLNGPMGWAPIALLRLGTPFISPLSASPANTRVASAPPLRSQSPRAPPRA